MLCAPPLQVVVLLVVQVGSRRMAGGRWGPIQSSEPEVQMMMASISSLGCNYLGGPLSTFVWRVHLLYLQVADCSPGPSTSAAGCIRAIGHGPSILHTTVCTHT